ncbi:MAG: hypothetical protein V4504_02110 [Patescibacteria group bacterium]
MSSIIKTFVILIILAGIGFGVYFYFFKQDGTIPVVTPVTQNTTQSATPSNAVPQDFLTILLSVKKINLNQEIFKNPAFATLQNSTIVLIPDGNEGRPNPFAPIGVDPVESVQINTTTPTTPDITVDTTTSPDTASTDFVLPQQKAPTITITPTKGN